MFNLVIKQTPKDHPNGVPGHLAGHQEETHTDEGAIKYMMEQMDCKSLFDVGAGPCGMTKLARDMGMTAYAIEGDDQVEKAIDDCIIHDFTKSMYSPKYDPETFVVADVAWACEVLEHIWPIYAPNFMPIFNGCKWAVFTMAEPGQPGHHHVNCQPPGYWNAVFNFYGFEFDEEHTNGIRNASTMTARYLRTQGIVFRNSRYLPLQKEYL